MLHHTTVHKRGKLVPGETFDNLIWASVFRLFVRKHAVDSHLSAKRLHMSVKGLLLATIRFVE